MLREPLVVLEQTKDFCRLLSKEKKKGKSNFQKFQILPGDSVRLLLSSLLDAVFSAKNWYHVKSMTYHQVFFIFD